MDRVIKVHPEQDIDLLKMTNSWGPFIQYVLKILSPDTHTYARNVSFLEILRTYSVNEPLTRFFLSVRLQFNIFVKDVYGAILKSHNYKEISDKRTLRVLCINKKLLLASV